MDEIIKAEIIWSLHVSVENNSFRSCDSIGGTFKAMFPDSVVAKKFSLSRTKVSYMLSDGIGPAFHQQITDEYFIKYFIILDLISYKYYLWLK